MQLDVLAPSEVVQLLLPPPPAIVSTKCDAREPLHVDSALLPPPRITKTLFVHVLFQVVSGMYPRAEASFGSLVKFQYWLATPKLKLGPKFSKSVPPTATS